MKYTKKPVTIEAVQYIGNNWREIENFTSGNSRRSEDSDSLIIKTLEGQHIASINDFIIKGIKGEFYPCKPDIFELTYSKKEVKND